jgi:hypothetical protein
MNLISLASIACCRSKRACCWRSFISRSHKSYDMIWYPAPDSYAASSAAQAGAFVPAKAATIGIVDRLFSRVGAADDLARGRSTFMVEMVETAAILNQATAKSLVILDEIGRGTATFDGLSIAWATLEHLHDVNRCRALFATHYHELGALKEALEGRYVEPGPGGDPIRNPLVLPTGKNIHALDPQSIPTAAALKNARVRRAQPPGPPPPQQQQQLPPCLPRGRLPPAQTWPPAALTLPAARTPEPLQLNPKLPTPPHSHAPKP